MNPFSLDHIFHRSHSYRNPRQVMTLITISVPRLHLSGQLHHGLFTQRTPGAIQRTLRIRSPFPRLSKNALTVIREISAAVSAALLVEVWGLEPQTYGLQSHRSSH